MLVYASDQGESNQRMDDGDHNSIDGYRKGALLGFFHTFHTQFITNS